MKAVDPALGRITIDATNQRAGGGLQVALTTLEGLDSEDEIQLICLEGSPLIRLAERRGWELLLRRDTRLQRLWRQAAPTVFRNRDIETPLAYTIFGPPLRGRRVGVSVAGVAYSNLFYPEIDFWASEPWIRKLRRRIRDRMRLRALLKADGLIFETEATRARALRQHTRLRPEHTAVFPPSPRGEFGRVADSRSAPPESLPRILMAASWHPNKNLEQVPHIAAALVMMDFPVRFVLTLDPDSLGASTLREVAARMGVEDQLEFVGKISPQEMPGLVGTADCILLISELESFSNNVIEAFAAGVPLVISDRDWARAAARDAAIYCEPADPDSVARALVCVISSPERREALAAEGRRILETDFLSPRQRSRRIVEFCHEVGRLVGGRP